MSLRTAASPLIAPMPTHITPRLGGSTTVVIVTAASGTAAFATVVVVVVVVAAAATAAVAAAAAAASIFIDATPTTTANPAVNFASAVFISIVNSTLTTLRMPPKKALMSSIFPTGI